MTDDNVFYEISQRGLKIQRLEEINADLLAALEEYVDWHEANFALPSGNMEDPDQMNLVKAARAAIAKARGRAK